MTANQFHTRRILSVDVNGVPTLEGTNAPIVMTTEVSTKDIGRDAVCQNGLGETPSIVLFGVLSDSVSETDEDAPLILQNGASSIALHPDGRVRLSGIDVKLEAEATVSLDAARIDLN